MRNPRKALLRFTALGLISFLIAAAASAQNDEQLAEKALAATLYLEMADKDNNILGFGSGFYRRTKPDCNQLSCYCGSSERHSVKLAR